MTPSEFAAMIDLAQDHGEAVPTLDDYTQALETLRTLESGRDYFARYGSPAMQAQARAMQNMSAQESAMRQQLQAAGLQNHH